jgi:hypothetical protein
MRPSQRLPDLALNLFLSLGGHVELPDDEGLIIPLARYVETKPFDSRGRSKGSIRPSSGYRP